jgi:prolyl-tRNA editing enzyme YbaK/EbsC (Cys-tRNA(Pro) deacylase)
MSLLERDAVVKVRKALLAAGEADTIVELAETARSAEDAAKAVGCELGAIVKSLVFTVGRRFVMALVAGDHRCLEENLPAAFHMEGAVGRPAASEVKGISGFTIGGVAPIGLAHPLPVVIDRSLKRFDKVYAAAGHPHCVFETSPGALARMTGGIVSVAIAAPIDPGQVASVGLKRSRSFTSGREKRLEGDQSG